MTVSATEVARATGEQLARRVPILSPHVGSLRDAVHHYSREGCRRAGPVRVESSP